MWRKPIPFSMVFEDEDGNETLMVFKPRFYWLTRWWPW